MAGRGLDGPPIVFVSSSLLVSKIRLLVSIFKESLVSFDSQFTFRFRFGTKANFLTGDSVWVWGLVCGEMSY